MAALANPAVAHARAPRADAQRLQLREAAAGAAPALGDGARDGRVRWSSLEHSIVGERGSEAERRPAARKALGRSKICQLAHAFMWEYSLLYKGDRAEVGPIFWANLSSFSPAVDVTRAAGRVGARVGSGDAKQQ